MSRRELYKTKNLEFPFPGAKRSFFTSPRGVSIVLKKERSGAGRRGGGGVEGGWGEEGWEGKGREE
jgi:hypothetical protein